MPKTAFILRKVHSFVHFSENESFNDYMKSKKKYSIGFYPAKEIARWGVLSKKEREAVLEKEWYLRWSYRNPETGKMERQDNIKAGVNFYKSKQERLEILNTLQRNLEHLLKSGYSPYEDEAPGKQEIRSVTEAIDFGFNLKKEVLGKTYFNNFKACIKRFEKYLIAKGYGNRFITSVDKKVVNQYLNHVLQASSARNRNNTRSDISSLFQVLEDNDIIPANFIKKIPVLKSRPNRNKTYTNDQVEAIYTYLEKKDPNLLLFIKFVSYNFLRPVEVCRLRVGDINLNEKTLTVKAKNKILKQKIIPEMLLDALPDLSKFDKDDFLFTPNGKPGKWEATENNKRDLFSRRFSEVKKHFGLGKEYGLYSFRHTFITKLYREMRKNLTPFETKSKLMLITGHTTMTALEKYLRDIDAELPEDYSELLK